jgi:hypothetical protein
MKSSLHSLIPFLPFLLNYSANCQLRRFSILCCNYQLRNSAQFLTTTPRFELRDSTKFSAPEMCLPHRCAATRAARTTGNTALLFLCPFASAGMRLPSRCLTMNYSGFHASCYNTEMDTRKMGWGGMDWIYLAHDGYH